MFIGSQTLSWLIFILQPLITWSFKLAIFYNLHQNFSWAKNSANFWETAIALLSLPWCIYNFYALLLTYRNISMDIWTNILMKMASLKDQAIRDQLKINHLKAWPYKCHLLTVERWYQCKFNDFVLLTKIYYFKLKSLHSFKKYFQLVNWLTKLTA